MKSMKKRMFYNIEVMIGIAILGIIIAIAIPAVAKSLVKHGYSGLWAFLLFPTAFAVLIGPAWCKEKISNWCKKRREKTDD